MPLPGARNTCTLHLNASKCPNESTKAKLVAIIILPEALAGVWLRREKFHQKLRDRGDVSGKNSPRYDAYTSPAVSSSRDSPPFLPYPRPSWIVASPSGCFDKTTCKLRSKLRPGTHSHLTRRRRNYASAAQGPCGRGIEVILKTNLMLMTYVPWNDTSKVMYLDIYKGSLVVANGTLLCKKGVYHTPSSSSPFGVVIRFVSSPLNIAPSC